MNLIDKHLEELCNVLVKTGGGYTWTVPQLYFVLKLTTSVEGRQKLIDDKGLRKQVSILVDRINDGGNIFYHLSDEMQSMFVDMFTFWEEISVDDKPIFDIKEVYRRLGL